MKNRQLTMKTPLKTGEIIIISLVIILALLFGVVISSEVFVIAEVTNVSMQDTLIAGEKLFISKSAYRMDLPERGDIIVFLKGETRDGFKDRFKIAFEDIFFRFSVNMRENRLIKRVIGLPGDTIEFRDGQVYLNNEKLSEDYIKGSTNPFRIKDILTVPDDMVFVMGDNRENSSDSRIFGYIDIESIEGRAVFRFWPFDRVTKFND